MAQRYFLHLAYKGTRYFGWQIQPNQISVQQEIENALTQLNSNKKVEITGCGRTDTGVHASDYYAHFDSESEHDLIHLHYKLNLMLPADIAILSIHKVQNDLHARFSATSRMYEYKIHTVKNPFISDISWYNKLKVDNGKINSACQLIAGYSDFKCFSKVNTDVTSFKCEIQSIQWLTEDNGFTLRIKANRFLRNMVRAITGTLIEVGTGKISLNELQKILESGDRSMAGVSVPAHGLTLVKVDYPPGSF